MALRMVIDKSMGIVSRMYQRSVASQLTQTGESISENNNFPLTGVSVCFSSHWWIQSILCLQHSANPFILYSFDSISILETGLRYEDIVNENEKTVEEALSLADPDILTARSRRLKRAIDLNFKRKNFMDYAADVEQDTWKKEFYDDVLKIKARDQEYAMLNAHNK